MGVLPYFENGRIYPRSEQATTIRDALLKTCEILNIKFLTECNIDEIQVKNDKFIISNNEFNAVILETYPNDTLTFIGKGAGSLPTASAIVLDIIDIIEDRCLNNYQNINRFKIN